MSEVSKGSGIFGCPEGQVTIEVPDGVSKTMGDGVVHNSLTNSRSAYGGPDACGWGAFGDDGPDYIFPGGKKPGFRVD